MLCLDRCSPGEPRSQTRRFDATVQDLVQLRDWLSSKSITHVVMESTGSYWVPFFNILEGHFIIVLANPEEVKNRSGQKRAIVAIAHQMLTVLYLMLRILLRSVALIRCRKSTDVYAARIITCDA